MSKPDAGEITRLLARVRDGHAGAADRLIALVYDDLRVLARRQLNGRAPGHTLQPTALVHETYQRLVGQASRGLENREHFLAVAAKAMRCVLMDHARAKARGKRAGARERLELDEAMSVSAERDIDLLALDEALEKLARSEPERAHLVEMRFFGGLTLEEASVALGVSLSTAKRHWSAAKVWLFRELGGCADG